MPSTTTQDALTQDLPCQKCHYNLRTLTPSQLCPECATPISHSILAHQNASRFRYGYLELGALSLAAIPIILAIAGNYMSQMPPTFWLQKLPSLIMDAALIVATAIAASAYPLSSASRRRFWLPVLLAAVVPVLRASEIAIPSFHIHAVYPFRHDIRYLDYLTPMMSSIEAWTCVSDALISLAHLALILLAWRLLWQIALRNRRYLLFITTFAALGFCTAVTCFFLLAEVSLALSLLGVARLFEFRRTLVRIDANALSYLLGMVHLILWSIVALTANQLRRRSSSPDPTPPAPPPTEPAA